MTPLRAKIEARREREWEQAKRSLLSMLIVFGFIGFLGLAAWVFLQGFA